MRKSIGFLIAVVMFTAPFTSFADSIVSATAGTGATVSPSGATLVTTGAVQTFNFGALTGYRLSNVTLNGTSLGAINSLNFTGDLTDYSLVSSAVGVGGGTPLYCSSPIAPGWNSNLADGGCGGKSTYVPYGGMTIDQGKPWKCPYMGGCMVPK